MLVARRPSEVTDKAAAAFAVGHLINDAAMPWFKSDTVTIGEAGVAVEIYLNASRMRQNVELDNNFW